MPYEEAPQTPDYILPAAQTERPDAEVQERIRRRCKQIAEIYKDMLPSFQKTSKNTDNSGSHIVADKDARRQIADLLIKNGISVLEPSQYNIDLLRSADDFSSFWSDVSSGKDSQLETVTLSDNGNFYYQLFVFEGGEKYYIFAAAGWIFCGGRLSEEQTNGQAGEMNKQAGETNKQAGGMNEQAGGTNEQGNRSADGQLDIETVDITKTGISDWICTDKGNFIYNCEIPESWGTDGHRMIRLNAPDAELAQYQNEYIAPIGYQANNLFLEDWDETSLSCRQIVSLRIKLSFIRKIMENFIMCRIKRLYITKKTCRSTIRGSKNNVLKNIRSIENYRAKIPRKLACISFRGIFKAEQSS